MDWTLAFLTLLAVFPRFAYTDKESFLEKVCYNALETRDPYCLNGGTLHATNKSDYLNCASCDCLDGWRGVDCGLCSSTNMCPQKKGKTAVSCTSTSISPTSHELIAGKQLSCYCGGDDPTTKYICKMQPGTNWQITIPAPNDEGFFDMSVIERAGIPSQDYRPSCEGYDPNRCPTKERYRYSVSQVFEGKFLNCYWEKGDCVSPLKGKDCVVYKCKDVDLECPPSYVKKCPGWTPFRCGYPPGEDRRYWMHHCNSLAMPMASLDTKLACRASSENGKFQCYMTQEESIFASVGMQCETGSCIYEDQAEGTAIAHKKSDKDFVDWLDDNQAELVIGLMVFCLIVLLIIAIILVISDKRRSRYRVEVWVNDASNNISDSLTPLLQTRASQQDLVLSQSLVLHFDEIQYFVRNGVKGVRQILRSVHGVAAPHSTHQDRIGSMLAIMGPSGAGKTSLLDILSGYRQVGVKGVVRVNGTEMKAGDRHMRKIAGYVQQDDVLPGTSTVFEYLLFNAALRMPKNVRREEKEKRVFDVIQQLGLSKIAHSFIGDQFTRGISGGEKRRVTIACERLVGPKLVFLDEPTTGLDSTNASKVVDILSDMATTGVTIVMSIHQPRPDLFRTLDRAMLLSSIGQVIYSGPAIEAENYFLNIGYTSSRKTVHVMDYMLDVVIKADQPTVNALVHGFSTSDIKENEDNMVETLDRSSQVVPIMKFRSTFLQQVRCLSTRLLRNTSRHPFLIALNFVANFAVAVGLGLLFHDTGHNTDGIQSRLGVLFFIVMFLSTMSLSSLPVWREERLLFKRERGNGVYGASAYFLSVLLFDLIPLRVLPPMFFAILSYWMIGLHDGCALCILWFTLIVVLTNVVASLTNMTIGAATPTNAVANALGSLVVLIFLLFAGYFLNKDEMPKWCKVFSHLSYFNYGYAGLVINEFKDAPGEFVFTALIDKDKEDKDGDGEEDEFPELRVYGKMILCEFGFDDKLFIFDVVMLCIIGGVCCLITYAILLMSGWDLTPSLDVSKLQNQDDDNVFLSQASSIESQVSMDDSSIRENAPLLLTENGEAQTSIQPLTLSWQNVSCSVSTTLLRSARTILSNINGIAGPTLYKSSSMEPANTKSMLFAIMGPSGAGKTTLIDILAGRKRDMGVRGYIKIDGAPTTARMIRRLSGYVLQDNVLPGTPTVFEHIMFHAQLRIPLPNYLTEKQRERRLKSKVKHICQQLGLERVLHNRIGDAYIRGLSGGERKRVSIACELLVDPGLLFLDEPTSGLDSTNATQVIDILSKTSLSGVTVIMSIHQPRPTFFTLIDKIMMLSSDGQLVFSGDSQMAERHFESFGYESNNESIDVFDYMLDLIIKLPEDNVRAIVSSFEESESWMEDQKWILETQKKAMDSDEHVSWSQVSSSKAKYHASHWTQIKVLSTRMGRNLYRHPLLLFVNFFSALFISLMLGAVYRDIGMNTAGIQNRLGSLFFIITYLSLMSLSSLPLWHDDRLLFVRERASGAYGTTSYFIANILFDVIPMRVLPPCFFALFTYWMIGYHASTLAVLRLLFIIILCNIAASTFSLAIGASIDSTSMANLVASLFILMANLLGGFFLSRKTLFSGLDKLVDIISKLSFVRYAFEALLLNEFHDRDGFVLTASHRCIPGKDEKAPGFNVTGDDILKTFGFPTSWNHYNIDIAALVCFIVVHGLITFLLFKFRDRPGEPSIIDRIKHRVQKIIGMFFDGQDVEIQYSQSSNSLTLV